MIGPPDLTDLGDTDLTTLAGRVEAERTRRSLADQIARQARVCVAHGLPTAEVVAIVAAAVADPATT